MYIDKRYVENLINKVQTLGWENIPEPTDGSDEFFKFFSDFEKEQKNLISFQIVSYETFKWLVLMAVYVVCSNTKNINFKNL